MATTNDDRADVDAAAAEMLFDWDNGGRQTEFGIIPDPPKIQLARAYLAQSAELARPRAELADARKPVDAGEFAGHTPGLWHWVKARTMQHLHAANGNFACISMPLIGHRHYRHGSSADIDSRLIAAAPSLLAERDRLRAANAELAGALTAAKCHGSQGTTDDGTSVDYLIEKALNWNVAIASHAATNEGGK